MRGLFLTYYFITSDALLVNCLQSLTKFTNMDLSLSLDAKEVLFHLNYMGYRNVTKDQLKFFMTGNYKLFYCCIYF